MTFFISYGLDYITVVITGRGSDGSIVSASSLSFFLLTG